MFRDESKSVVRKAAAGATKHKRPGRSPRTASPEGNLVRPELTPDAVDPLDFNSDPQHAYLMKQLGQCPLEVQPTHDIDSTKYEAICYFMRSNCLPGTFWNTDLVTKFLLQTGGPASQKAMQSSVIATATAMLSRVRELPRLKEVAHQEYGSALRLLNSALSDADEAKTNQTLGAVVLLAIYEVRCVLLGF